MPFESGPPEGWSVASALTLTAGACSVPPLVSAGPVTVGPAASTPGDGGRASELCALQPLDGDCVTRVGADAASH